MKRKVANQTQIEQASLETETQKSEVLPTLETEAQESEAQSTSNPDLGFLTNQNKDGFKSGFVAFVGRPNAGKSTLINAIMGKKIAITSNTAQTTRHRFRAIYNTEKSQIIFIDTPGLHKPQDALGEELNISALKALEDVDVVAMLIDIGKPIGTGDAWVASKLKNIKAKKICVLTKSDICNKKQIDAQRASAIKLMSGAWDAMVCLSSVSGKNIDALIEEIEYFLPLGPAWFPPDMQTDQPLEVMIAEYIREKILRSFSQEIPHAIGVALEDMQYIARSNTYNIQAIIYVERTSQKRIIIGRGGSAIKKIGTQARLDLQKLLGTKVYLDLHVKVKKNWRRDVNQIRRFGYGDGA